MHNFERYAFYLMLLGLALCILGYMGAVLAAFRVSLPWGFGVLLFPPSVVAFCITNARKAPVPALLLLTGALLVGAPYAANAASPWFINLGPLEDTVNGELHVTLTGWDHPPKTTAPPSEHAPKRPSSKWPTPT